MVQGSVEALAPNSPQEWDSLWAKEGRDSWRGKALAQVYERIAELIPRELAVVDVGGGVGLLADVLRDVATSSVTVLDVSVEAVSQARGAGHKAEVWDAEDPTRSILTVANALVATEVLEHLSDAACTRLLTFGATCRVAFFSVPNDRLGPEEEPQHHRKWTAMQFKQFLEGYWPGTVRVECLGPVQPDSRAPAFLLGICGLPMPKLKLSVTLPVRDEAVDLPLTLASFRGVAHEIIVGVDPRTKDDTREQAAKYADVVFNLVDPGGATQPDPPPLREGKDPVHFAWLRNQCLDRCTGDWAFMTEGHEALTAGQDTLLRLDQVFSHGAEKAKVACVLRRANGQRWGFPWMTRLDDKRLRYYRNTHNMLVVPDDVFVVQLPQVHTTHLRDHVRQEERAIQRRSQNRISLMHDWTLASNVDSLFYLAGELREISKEKSHARMREYLAVSNNGAGRYQMRLVLGKELAAEKEYVEARAVLVVATGDDWSRTEHWFFLGEMTYELGKHEEALQWWRYAATAVGQPMPFAMWWIDEAIYTYLPAMRMAQVLVDLGRYAEALHWAERVKELLPADTPNDVIEECDENIAKLKEALQ